jgi:hypothetical protein
MFAAGDGRVDLTHGFGEGGAGVANGRDEFLRAPQRKHVVSGSDCQDGVGLADEFVGDATRVLAVVRRLVAGRRRVRVRRSTSTGRWRSTGRRGSLILLSYGSLVVLVRTCAWHGVRVGVGGLLPRRHPWPPIVIVGLGGRVA